MILFVLATTSTVLVIGLVPLTLIINGGGPLVIALHVITAVTFLLDHVESLLQVPEVDLVPPPVLLRVVLAVAAVEAVLRGGLMTGPAQTVQQVSGQDLVVLPLALAGQLRGELAPASAGLLPSLLSPGGLSLARRPGDLLLVLLGLGLLGLVDLTDPVEAVALPHSAAGVPVETVMPA